jgi:spectinomycin phosphotransferase
MAAPADPVAADLAGAWRARKAVISALVERADGLGRDLARRSFPPVLCHADLHTHTVLVGADQQLWIVDWDEAVLAPRERDLMFVVGGGIGQGLLRAGEDDRFFEGYGETAVEERLLAYYRCAWAVQDILANAEEVLVPAGLGEAARRAAVAGFLDLFAPGNIVDLARGQAA